MELHLTNLVPEQIAKALCNTLIHSLWQGLILAAVTGLTIVLTKKASAALRYNLMIGFLLLFTAGITFTFFTQLHMAGIKQAAPIAITTQEQILQANTNPVIVTEKPGNILSNCIGYFNNHSDMIVLIWFLIICARFVQMAAGLHTIYHIKRTKTLSAGAFWDHKIEELSQKLGIERTVQIMQSGIAKLPMVLGHFKPMILIPVGLLTALSAEEVESILVHELAHIHRRDYLVNLLQNLMEIVFFFNPAVLWVSSLIKAERENCCDDIVVAQTSSKVSYIKALVSCQEYQESTPAFAMGLGGTSDHFLKRVKRMLSNNNQSLNRIEKMVLTICLISAVLLTAAFSNAGKAKEMIRSISKKAHTSKHNISRIGSTTRIDSANSIKVTARDTDMPGEGTLKIYKPAEIADGSMLRFVKKIKHQIYITYLLKKGGVLYQYSALDNGADATYYVNGNAVPKDKQAEYQPQFDRLVSEVDQMNSPNAPAKPGELQHNGAVGEIVDKADSIAQARTNAANYNEDSNEKALAPLKANMGRLSTKQALDSMKLRALADSKGKLNAKQATLNRSLTAMDTARAIAAYKYKMMGDSDRRAWHKTPNTPVTPKYAYSYSKPYQPAKPYAPVAPIAPPSPVSTIGDKITKQLIDSHLIRDKNNYNFKITNDVLYIDGVKQSDKIHDQIIKSYLKPGDHINLTRTNKTTN